MTINMLRKSFICMCTVYVCVQYMYEYVGMCEHFTNHRFTFNYEMMRYKFISGHKLES